MKVLLDQGTPVPLRRHLHPHLVDTSAERGWATLQNGELLNQAESGRYDALVTTDKKYEIPAEPHRTQSPYSCSFDHFVAMDQQEDRPDP